VTSSLKTTGNIHAKVRVNGQQKLRSHYVWFKNTGHWPDFENKQEVIHHLDGDSLNDDFANLQLMTSSEHSSLHNKGEKHPKYGAKFSEKYRHEWKGERNPNWLGDAASITAKYNRHRRNPSLYPPLTDEERREYNAYNRERRRKRQAQQD